MNRWLRGSSVQKVMQCSFSSTKLIILIKLLPLIITLGAKGFLEWSLLFSGIVQRLKSDFDESYPQISLLQALTDFFVTGIRTRTDSPV